MSVCVADVNNDGNQDILIGAPLQSVVNHAEGMVFVYYGTGDVCIMLSIFDYLLSKKGYGSKLICETIEHYT